MGCIYALCNPCEPESFTGHTLLVFHQVNFQTQNVFKREVNEKLCIGEIGVDLEPLCSCPWEQCNLIMEASHNNNCPSV